MVRLWELKIKQKEIKRELPVIIPLLIYHGRGKWEINKRLIGLFGDRGDRLKEYIPDFRYVSHLKDEEIKGEIRVRVLLLILKYIFREDLRDRLEEILGLLKDLEDKRSGIEYIEVLERLLEVAVRSESVEKIREELGELRS